MKGTSPNKYFFSLLRLTSASLSASRSVQVFLLTFTFCLLSFTSSATHLMGGNLYYQYIGETFPGSGMYTYKIIFKTYTNCDSSSQVPTPEPSVDIGIYEETTNPNSNKPLFTTITLPLVDSSQITPQLPNGCTVGLGVCIYEGVYEANVDLPIMPGGSFSKGYYVYYERCCRNGSIVNLLNPGTQGMGFSAFIPPPLTVNSSPVFTDKPLPYVCVNDTAGILNTAVDPDGDLLLFSFEDPYEGEYTGNGQGGNPPPVIGTFPDPIDFPFPVVTWQNGGYDKNNPFGPSGFAFINSFTGYSQYYSPTIGKFVVAVEIKEFRNGNLIGITRRDMQLIVLNCPSNPAPVLSTTGGSGQLSYTIQEGQSLCFPVTYTDANGNAITLSSSGNIFNSSVTNPAATISTPVTGTGSVTTQFCWNTGCSQGQSLPYLFNAQATDNGCPPKTTPIVYSITVNNFTGPSSITGTNTVCPGMSGISYSTTSVANATYNWVITGGSVASGQGTNAITVNWGNGPSGNVAVTTSSQFGCSAGPINLPITFSGSLPVLAGADKTICKGDTVSIGGSPTNPVGTTLVWSPSSGLSSTSASNPVASPTSTITYIATATNGSGCTGKDSVKVIVNPVPTANAGTDTTICLSDTVQLNASGGGTYLWSPSTGLSNPNIQNPQAFPSDTTIYSVIVTNASNCKDTDQVTVFIITNAPADAGNNKTICAGDTVTIGGTVVVPNGTTFSWSPNINLSSSTILNPVASPVSTVTYTLTVTTPTGCVGVDSVKITSNPVPIAKAGNDTLVCDGDTAHLAASGGGTYQWSGAGLSNTTISNPLAIPVNTTNYIVTVSNLGCSKKDTVKVTVFSSTISVTADTGICKGDTVQLSVSASGNSVFVWTPAATLSNGSIANPFAFPNGTITYFVNATDTNTCSKTDSVKVIVNPLPNADAGANKKICIGDTTQLNATGGNTFVWTPATFLSNDSIVNPLAFPNDTTTYFVKVTDSKKCSNTDSIKIIVNPLPVVQASNDTSICKNGTAHLNATGGINFLWSPSSTLNNPNIQSPQANPTAPTKYFVNVTDSNGCKGIDSVLVSIFQTNISAGNDTGICTGDTMQLFATGGAVFVWTPSATLSDDSIANPLAFPNDTTTYFVTGTDTNTCSKSDSVKVLVYPLPVINATNDTAVCSGKCVALFATGASNFVWSPITGLNNPNIANPTSCVNDTIVYYVTGSNAFSGGNSNLIFNGDFEQRNTGFTSDYSYFPPQVTVPPSIITGEYSVITDLDSVHNNSWVGNDHTTGSGNFMVVDGSTVAGFNIWCQTVPVAQNTNYNFSLWLSTLQINNLLSDAKIQVSINGIVIGTPLTAPANFGIWIEFQATWFSGNNTSAVICIKDLLTGSGVGNDFALDDISLVNPASSVCANTDSVKIIVNPLPVVQASNDTSICENGTAHLSATGGINFLWSPSSTLNNQNIQNPQANPTGTTLYFVNVTDGNSCKGKDSVLVSIFQTNISAGNDTGICTGDTMQLFATGGAVFVWTPSATLSDDSIANPLAFPNDTTTYFVNGTDTNTCTKSDSVKVLVYPLPVINATNDTAVCSGKCVALFATGANNFVWSPITGLDNPNIANPTSCVNDTIVYYVTGSGTSNLIFNGDFEQRNTGFTSDYSYFPPQVTVPPSIITGEYSVITDIDSVHDNSWVGSDHTTGSGNFMVVDGSTVAGFNVWCQTVPVSPNTNYNFSLWLSTLQINNLLSDAKIQVSINGIVLGAPLNAPVNFNIWVEFLTTWFSGNNTSAVICIKDLLTGSGVGNDFALDDISLVNQSSSICANTDSVKIIIHPLPVAQANNDTAICKGATVQLNAAGGTNYLWTPNDSLSNPNIANPQANPTDTTKYFVLVSDTNSCSVSDSVQINVKPVPLADAGTDGWVCPGDSTQLVANGGNFFSWTPTTGLSNAGVSSPMAGPIDTTVYFVTVTNLFSCSKTDSVTIFVNGIVPTEAGNNVFICLNDSAKIGGSPTSPNGSVFSWSPSLGLDSTTISNPTASPSDTTMYYIFTTNDTCSGKDSVLVIVNPLPSVDAGNDKAICIGDTTQLNATGGTSYVWNADTTLSDDSIANPFAFPTDTTKYFVTVIDANSCGNTDSVTIAVNQLPVVDAGADKEICKGDSVQLNATGGVFFVWHPSATLSDDSIANPFAKPTDTTKYFVSVKDSNSCANSDSVNVFVNQLPNADAGADKIICIGDTTQLNATGGAAFVWTPSLTLSDDSIANPLAFPVDTTIYFVNVTDTNSCSKNDSVTVIVNPLPNADAGANKETCIGDTIQLNASGGTVFLWTHDSTLSNDSISNPFAFPPDTAKYFVTVTDSNSCSKTDSVEIDVNALPTVSAGNDTSSCRDTSLVLGGNPTAPAGSVFLWSPSATLNNSSLANPTAKPDTTTTYYVNVTDSNGCKNIDSTIVSIFSVKSISDTSFCKGDSVTLFVIPVSGASPYIITWSPIAGLSDTDTSIVIAKPDSSILYIVTVKDGKGCSETKNISLIANSAPIADFAITLFPSCSGVLAEFKNKSDGATTYKWLFGDSDTSSTENPTHVFSYNQMLNATLTALNEFCSAQKSFSDDIKSFTDYFDMTVPSIFTPNGDGQNDCFEINPNNKLQECTDLHVFNRWGELMYASAGNQHSWCGRTFAGDDVPAGTYFYVIDINGILFKGAVTLMR